MLASLTGFALLALAAPVQEKPVSQKEISRELARMFAEHFQDQNMSDESELWRRKAARRDRAREIVAAGQLASFDDWDHAAVVIHYGGRPEDFLLAHALAIPPAIEDLSASRQLVAMTIDGYLNSLERKEPFGTMSTSPTAEYVLQYGLPEQPLPDSLRRAFQLNPLPGRTKQKHAKVLSPKELAKLSVEAEPEAWIARVRAVVTEGELESAKDLALVAGLLQRSATQEDLLIAHLLTLAAAFEGHKEGLRLSAQTLDRYLLATGQAQAFDTKLDEAGKPVEPRAPVPAVVQRGFGLLEPEKGDAKGKK